MLSRGLTQMWMQEKHHVCAYGLEKPQGYECSEYIYCDLLKDDIDYDSLILSDLIIYAAGAGVQAALTTPSSLMYALNVLAPINITLELKKRSYCGIFVSFGTYMEIGLNDNMSHAFTEEEVVCSSLPVTNDYALSKRLFSRYMRDFKAVFTTWHFILPNMFSYSDREPGTRLIPYVLQYLDAYKNGENPDSPSFSAGTQTRQFILQEEIFYVLINSLSQRLPSGVFNVGGGEFCSIRKFIENLFTKADVPCRDEYFGQELRRDGDIRSLRIDGTKLERHIHYLPSTRMIDIF